MVVVFIFGIFFSLWIDEKHSVVWSIVNGMSIFGKRLGLDMLSNSP